MTKQKLFALISFLMVLGAITPSALAWDSYSDIRISKVEINNANGEFSFYADTPVCKGSPHGVGEQVVFPKSTNDAASNRVLSLVLAAYLSGRPVRVFTVKPADYCTAEAISLL